MKIAYVTTYDSSDKQVFSGLGNALLLALQNSGFQTVSIGNLRAGIGPVFLSYIKRVVYPYLLSKRYFREREPAILRDQARHAGQILKATPHDIVFSPGTLPIAYLQTDRPVVFWTDATFAGMVDFYPEYTHVCAESLRNGNKIEQLALDNCRLAIYASEWAANSALRNYAVDPQKVKVVPFGANLTSERNAGDIERIVESKSLDVCRLLFMGVDWFRKGGDKAVAVASLLNQKGIKTELHVAGCNPPGLLPDFVIKHGFISKSTLEGARAFDELFVRSHFLILPTTAENYGLAFAEASSFGLPALGTKVGGIPTIIRDGRNGWTFAPEASPEEYCRCIQENLSPGSRYRELALSSFQEYTRRLNWASAGRQVHDLIEAACGS